MPFLFFFIIFNFFLHFLALNTLFPFLFYFFPTLEKPSRTKKFRIFLVPLTTNIANMIFRFGMCFDMLHKILLRHKRLVASSARIISLSRHMNFQMRLVSILGREGLAARIAIIRLDAQVRVHVLFQQIPRAILFPANLAGPCFRSGRMLPLMNAKQPATSERPAALIAHNFRLLACCMLMNVRQKIRLLLKRLPADVAKQVLQLRLIHMK